MTSTKPIRVLLAAPANIMGSSLRTFLATMAGIVVVGSVDEVGNIQSSLLEQAADICLLDADLFNGCTQRCLQAFLAGLPRAFPEMKSIVLVDSPTQQQAALQANSERVLLKGQLGEPLRAAILACVASGAGLEGRSRLAQSNKCLRKK